MHHTSPTARAPRSAGLRRSILAAPVILASLALSLGACPVYPDNPHQHDPNDPADDDGDGLSELQGDCDDSNPQVHPNAPEIPNGIDDNCDGIVDNDYDSDGFLSPEDCDDHDPAIHPGAVEECDNGVDDNCNGAVDHDEPDQDGDGFSVCDGDCNDRSIGMSPGNVEDPTDHVDNNCNGLVDETSAGCDCAAEPGETVTNRMARAIGLCNPNNILSITPRGDPRAYGAFSEFGAVRPRVSRDGSGLDGLPTENCAFVILATGEAGNPDPQNGDGMDLGIVNQPDPAPFPDGAQINDLTQLEIRLRVPGNARGFSFDFVFFSVEYPEFVCSEFNDTFYALVLDEPQLGGGARTNISFDSEHNEITVNNGFFEYPPYWSLDITGTAYETEDTNTFCSDDPSIGCVAPNPCPTYTGSTTGWLRTHSPATPGEEITIIFSIHDEGDNILDSAVVIDNFRWITVPVEDPGTVK